MTPNNSFKPTPLHGHNVSRCVACSIVAVQRRGLTQVLGRKEGLMRLAAQILLFVPILIGFWYVHSELSMWFQWLPDLFSARLLRLTGLLLGAVLSGIFAGIIFTAPIRLLYQRRALLAGVAVSLLATASNVYHMQFFGHLPFTKAALLLDLAALFLALPLCLFFLSRLRPNNSFKPTPLRGAA